MLKVNYCIVLKIFLGQVVKSQNENRLFEDSLDVDVDGTGVDSKIWLSKKYP
jgi:hypothetical protein